MGMRHQRLDKLFICNFTGKTSTSTRHLPGQCSSHLVGLSAVWDNYHHTGLCLVWYSFLPQTQVRDYIISNFINSCNHTPSSHGILSQKHLFQQESNTVMYKCDKVLCIYLCTVPCCYPLKLRQYFSMYSTRLLPLKAKTRHARVSGDIITLPSPSVPCIQRRG